MSAPNDHALLSPSSAEKWLHCPPSARLEEQFQEKTSKYAEEGRLAHSVAELVARKKFTVMSTRTYNSALKKLTETPGYAPEMLEHAQTYVEKLTELAMTYPAAPTVALEMRVGYAEYAPEGFGTSDGIMVGGNLLDVVDYKYGQGVPVSAGDNSQMKLYALGALSLFAAIYGDTLTTIRMTIVQPRIGNISTWSCTRDELLAWAENEVKPRAAMAWEGAGEYRSGAWCRFCRVSTCRHRAGVVTALEAFGGYLLPTPENLRQDEEDGQDGIPTQPILTDVEVGDLLRRGKELKDWLATVEDYALAACLEGKDIPGWKAVEGRSSRQWSDQDRALEAIMNHGYPREMVYDYVPKSLSALEKLIGKKAFEETASGYVIKPPGKPALAPESDSRPVYQPVNAAEYFGAKTFEGGTD